MNELAKREVALFEQDEDGGLSLKVRNFSFTKVGMFVEGDPTFEEWQDAGFILTAIERDIVKPFQWWIGDMLCFGQSRYGEKYSQLMDSTGLAYQSLANVTYVAAHVEQSRRHPGLSFSHHQEVASLEPDQQEHYLRWCEEGEEKGEPVSVQHLRAKVNKEVHGKTEIIFQCPECAAQFQVSREVRVLTTIRHKTNKTQGG